MNDIDIRKLAEQLDAAQQILDQIRVTSGCETFGPRRCEPVKRVETAVEAARRAYDERRARTNFVGHNDMFGEPAWDMLLDLFIRQANEEEITVKSACLNTDAPASTTTRWLMVLEHYGLIEMHCDPADPVRHLIHLTPTGYEGMVRYLESIAV